MSNTIQVGAVVVREAKTERGVVIARYRATVLSIDGEIATVVSHDLQRQRATFPVSVLRSEGK